MKAAVRKPAQAAQVLPPSVLVKSQKMEKRYDVRDEHGEPIVLIVEIRYDDECGNKHNTFAITGMVYDRRDRIPGEPVKTHKDGTRLWLGSCGCVHDDIEKYAPELAPLIKWHGTTSEGPLYYVENTMYHALEHGPTHAWIYYTGMSDPLGLAEKGEQLLSYSKADKAREAEGRPGYRVNWDEKTAKVANFDHARSTAIWPDATPEQLRDKAALLARLPGLMDEFRAAMQSLGFTY